MDKLLVQRANVFLQISADEKDKYLANGYSIIDEDGNVIERAIPNDVPSLKRLVVELQQRIKELETKQVKPRKGKTKE